MPIAACHLSSSASHWNHCVRTHTVLSNVAAINPATNPAARAPEYPGAAGHMTVLFAVYKREFLVDPKRAPEEIQGFRRQACSARDNVVTYQPPKLLETLMDVVRTRTA